MDSRFCALSIPCELKMLSPARAFLEGLCNAYGLDRSMTHAVVLATAEAITNVVRHGGQHNCNSQIRIQFRLTENAVEIQIHDDCTPFDIAAVPELDPREIRVGGRGIYLMRALMDELSCQHQGEQGNILRMVKRLRPSA